MIAAALKRMATELPIGWRTRFAPAPTGWLHLGHAANALCVWGVARAFGGRVVLRVEDHDRDRCRPEYERGLLEDLEWLGFAPDEDVPPQRDRTAAYHDALAKLEQAGLAYPCACSRRDVAAHVGDVFNEESRYPGTCRTRAVNAATVPARRVRMEPGTESFDDILLGPCTQDPDAQCGDFLIRDRRGFWTYQFAVTVDDYAQHIDVVIRGEDLLPSTGRQLRLARLLGRETMPRFLHHPLIRHLGGIKLSKSAGDTGIRELRDAGRSPAEVLGAAAHAAGFIREPRPIVAADAAALFGG